MRLRQYRQTDFSAVEKWIDSERIHALWCANAIPYPMTRESFHALLKQNAEQWGDSAFLATEDDGQLVGFFCYSTSAGNQTLARQASDSQTADRGHDTEDNYGFLKYVVLDPERRGQGCGTRMLKLALKHAFEITEVDYVQINVFDANEAARKCYARIGFTERGLTENALTFRGETWARHNLIIKKKNYSEENLQL